MRKDLDETRTKADEKAIVSVINTIESMINPFESAQHELVQLVSGTVATPAIANDMKTMQKKGESAAVKFMETNIVGQEPNIYCTIPKTKLQTFSELGKKVTSKSRKGKLVTLKNSKNLFAKMLLVAKSRNLQMEEVLKYSLRPFPCSLATNEGDLMKTVKSKLVSAVEGEVNDTSVDNPTELEKAYIVDAMAMIQTMIEIPDTFGELATQLLLKIVNMAVFSNSKRIDFVCDRYPRQSIKDLERNRRAASGVQVIRIYGEQQKTPRQWKKFMCSGENKEELMKFIFITWSKADPRLLKGITVFIAHEDTCHKLFEVNGEMISHEIEELRCDHEEADTRMITHAGHACQDYSTIVIRSPDTDVFFIALNACLGIDAALLFETGVGNRKRIISLNKVKQHFGDQWCSALIGIHAFTGNFHRTQKKG
jgi:hypothetical protein